MVWIENWVGIKGGKVQWNVLCEDECENVSHVLFSICNTKASFMKKLQELLEDDYDFESLENVEKYYGLMC